MKKILYFILIISFTFLIHLGCEKNMTSVPTPDPFYQNIDPEVTMIARINGSPFYGKEHDDPLVPTIWNPNTAIYAVDTTSSNLLSFSKKMITQNEIPYSYYTYLNFSGYGYYLLTDFPYQITFNSLTNKLIAGSFYATFINYQIPDTIDINNGIFNIKPDVPDNFFLSCSLKNTLFETQYGKEYLHRDTTHFQSEYNQFEDSTRVIIKFLILSLTNDYSKASCAISISFQLF